MFCFVLYLETILTRGSSSSCWEYLQRGTAVPLSNRKCTIYIFPKVDFNSLEKGYIWLLLEFFLEFILPFLKEIFSLHFE